MYRAATDYFTTCPACRDGSDSAPSYFGKHHMLRNDITGHTFMFCATCGYVQKTYSRTAFPGDPAYYRALWALLQE